MTSKPFEITSPPTFLEAYYACSNEEKNLLCELYQLSVLLFHYSIWNPNRFVGDLKFIAFLSYTNNHVDWVETHIITQHSYSSNF